MEYQIHTLLDMTELLRDVIQRKDYHPELDAFNHSMQVVHHALRESNDIDLILAAMAHDIGKAINPIGHEDIAVGMLKGLVSEKTLWLIENHMRVRYFLNGEMRKLSKVQELASNQWFTSLILLNRWDNMGRNANFNSQYDRVKLLSRLYEVSNF